MNETRNENMNEIDWLRKTGQELDVDQSNKHLICKWFIRSEDDDDLCLGNGSHKDNEKAKKLQELLLKQNPNQEELDNAFREYIKIYNFREGPQNNNASQVLKLINIRTCGLERYLVYLNNDKVGIYVPTKEEEKNLEGKIHFPLYIHESMSYSQFEKAKKNFYTAIDKVRGQIIKIGDGAEESNRSKIEGARFGVGSDYNRRLNKGVGAVATVGTDSARKKKFEDLRARFTGGGIMFGQLLADINDDDIIFNLIGKFDTNTGLLSESDNDVCEKNKCDNLILRDYFTEELELEQEHGNDVYTSRYKNLKIFPKGIYGDSMGKPNYDIKIPSDMRNNIEIFCNKEKLNQHKEEMDKLKNDSEYLGKQMNINIKKRRELINNVKKLKQDLYENMTLYDNERVRLSEKKESEELNVNESELLNALEELKKFDERRELINNVKNLKEDLNENMYDKERVRLSEKKESEDLTQDEEKLLNALEELKKFDEEQGTMLGGTRKRRRSRKNKRGGYRKMRRTRGRRTKRCGSRGKSKRMDCTYSKSRLRSRKNKKLSRRR